MFVRRGSGKTLRRTDFQNSYYNVWIQKISKDQLRQMGDQEGLVLQGCGGDPQGWLDTSDLGNGETSHGYAVKGVESRNSGGVVQGR